MWLGLNHNLHTMATKIKQSLFLGLAAMFVYFYTRSQKEDINPYYVVNEILAHCQYDPPGDYRHGPYSKSITLCESVDRKEAQELMYHMHARSVGMAAAIAAEFGSNVKIGYIVKRKLFIINPIVMAKGDHAVPCLLDTDSGNGEKHIRASTVDVRYMTSNFEYVEERFEQADALLVQAMIEAM